MRLLSNLESMLIVVESPAKAKKIQTFFQKDKNIIVQSSYGHINNLAKENLGIDIDNNFKPTYSILPEKMKIVKQLKKYKDKEVILAADDDREGDAIAWHCGNALNVDFNQNNRIIFREINQNAIQSALKNIHQINMDSVHSQQARQIIDKLIGFKLSPLLWENIQTEQKGLSAGRVQSTLLLLLKNHEDTIRNFESEYEYEFTSNFQFNQSNNIQCELYFHIDDIDPMRIMNVLKKNKLYTVQSLTHKKVNDYPPKPLITSSLQQSAQSTYGFPIRKTMNIAQKLYENGKITYMRTDSTYMSPLFVESLQSHIHETFGENYYNNPKYKMKKVKGAQEAHECIRVTDVKHKLNNNYNDDDRKLYGLILKRTIISHMKPSIYNVMTVQLMNDDLESIGVFEGKHKTLLFDGYLKYNQNEYSTTDINISKDTQFKLMDCICKDIESKPPHYYNESSIVKKLESSGIGRPSTYASIISTLSNRNYTECKTIEGIEKEMEVVSLTNQNEIVTTIEKYNLPTQKNKIRVTPLGIQVLNYLLEHFDNIINIQFTSLVEKDLDLIAEGEIEWYEVVRKVYHSFYQKVDRLLKKKPFNPKVLGKHKQSKVYLKQGKYGPYLNIQNKNISLSSFLKKKDIQLDSIQLKDIIHLLK